MTDRFQTWFIPPKVLAISSDEVHVWLVSLDPLGQLVERLPSLLSPTEVDRANRFHFTIDSNRYAVTRACLRIILARYLQTNPAEIEFTYGKFGKPDLKTSDEETNKLRFNVSHSRGRAMYAFTRGREVGVDIERIRPDIDLHEIARRFFSTIEVRLLEELPSEVQHQAFFNCWTRKEAFIKANGKGLSLALDQFDVTLAPGLPALLLQTRWDESEAQRWSLKSIDVGSDYAGAVSVAGQNWKLFCWKPDEEFFTLGIQGNRQTAE